MSAGDAQIAIRHGARRRDMSRESGRIPIRTARPFLDQIDDADSSIAERRFSMVWPSDQVRT
jgi:hypothetical protein